LTDMAMLAFDSETGADKGRQKLVELNNEYLLNLVDAVEVVRHARALHWLLIKRNSAHG